MQRVIPLFLATVWLGCGTAPGSGPGLLLPVDGARVSSADVSAWPHRRRIDADLNGDGRAEGVVVVADVALNDAGQPLWEDGHRWVVLVHDPPAQTLVYAAFVPNGHVEAGVSGPDDDGTRRVLVAERTPRSLRVWEIAYDGPDRARAVAAGAHEVDRWVPTLAGP